MYRWHAFSYEWFGTKTRFARGKSQLFIHELLREPLINSGEHFLTFGATFFSGATFFLAQIFFSDATFSCWRGFFLGKYFIYLLL